MRVHRLLLYRFGVLLANTDSHRALVWRRVASTMFSTKVEGTNGIGDLDCIDADLSFFIFTFGVGPVSPL